LACRTAGPAGARSYSGPYPPFVGRQSRRREAGGQRRIGDAIDYGPGYRLYFVGRGKTVVILLCGGDKRRQDRDIAQAIEMAQKV